MQKSNSRKVALVILDGWGIGSIKEVDAIAQANTPFYNQLLQHYPHAQLITHGLKVGLPNDQMGNSEVGHLNIGAGRVVYQDLAKINRAIELNELKDNEVLKNAINHTIKNKTSMHLMGLLSDGGVHSHYDHLIALIDIIEDTSIQSIYIHAFTDGRDVDPHSGKQFVEKLMLHLKNKKSKLATIIGRYYAMDRDNRWERISKAYHLLVNSVGTHSENPVETIQNSYNSGISDEFLEPIIVNTSGTIKPHDTVIFFNYRSDRPREITSVLTQQDMEEFEMVKLPLHFVTMTKYDANFNHVDIMFEKDNIDQTLGQVVSFQGKSQVRIAETEKYPHVTFFFSGGRELPYTNEKRILIPSPKVPTYDLQPEMSANEITEAIVKSIKEDQPDFICLNYANTDMVGHTGNFKAAIAAADTIDINLKTLVEAGLNSNYDFIIIADHGNSDFMINEDGSPNTAHTKNPVPIIYVSNNSTYNHIVNGILADVAPTILKLMNLEQPKEMTGTNLLSE